MPYSLWQEQSVAKCALLSSHSLEWIRSVAHDGWEFGRRPPEAWDLALGVRQSAWLSHTHKHTPALMLLKQSTKAEEMAADSWVPCTSKPLSLLWKQCALALHLSHDVCLSFRSSCNAPSVLWCDSMGCVSCQPIPAAGRHPLQLGQPAVGSTDPAEPTAGKSLASQS